MILTFDVEATGLDVERDKVHCLVAKDVETGKIYEFRPKELSKVKTLFDSARKLVAHNGISYDVPILRSNGIVDIPHEKVIDTLVLSRLYYPDREKHSVEWWGKKLGYPKVEHEEWSVFTEDMLHRCRTDVEIQTRIYKELLKEKDGDWDLAERIEHKIQEILFEQEQAGWKFDLEEAKRLVSWLEGEMERLENEMDFGTYYIQKGDVNKPFRKDGTLAKQVTDWTDEDVGGPFGKIEWHKVGLSQKGRVKNALLKMGWVPTSYTEKGSPQLSPNGEVCPNLAKMGGVGEKLSHYSLCAHRKGQISGWIEHCREDGRIPAKVAGITNTGRLRHSVVANVPKAEESVFLGKEMRQLFTCAKGTKLVGLDADSLELRNAAHRSNSKPFVKALVEGDKSKGTDAHTKIWKMAEQYGVEDRHAGKTANYMGIYGASGKKFAQSLNISNDKGYKVRDIVAKAFPGLMELKPKVEEASKRGYLVGIDGRKVWMRRDPAGKVMTHKALNTLFQSDGGILLKFALCVLDSYCKKEGLGVKFVGNIHDEIQAEVVEKDVDRYKQLCYTAFKKTSDYFKLRCPIECEVMVGNNWSETH